jgi:hypothetical protein
VLLQYDDVEAAPARPQGGRGRGRGGYSRGGYNNSRGGYNNNNNNYNNQQQDRSGYGGYGSPASYEARRCADGLVSVQARASARFSAVSIMLLWRQQQQSC